jgi:hypothetical protein
VQRLQLGVGEESLVAGLARRATQQAQLVEAGPWRTRMLKLRGDISM